MTILELKDRIYAEYYEKVKSYVGSHVADMSVREDLVQDIFLKIYSRLDSYDEGKASLSTWIYTITKNTVINYYRKRERFSSLPEALADEETVDDSMDEDALSLLAEALSRLGERERDLIILHYFSGYTLKSIAEMMNISYIYAKVLHKKALTELEGLMGG